MKVLLVHSSPIYALGYALVQVDEAWESKDGAGMESRLTLISNSWRLSDDRAYLYIINGMHASSVTAQHSTQDRCFHDVCRGNSTWSATWSH
jgi:hypothetical protein